MKKSDWFFSALLGAIIGFFGLAMIELWRYRMKLWRKM